MTAQNLKNAILQLAMQGKLVPQDPEDEPASELLKRVCVRKKPMLIDRGTMPFDIPDSWQWSYISDVGELIRGSGIKRSETVDKGFPCVRYGELYTTYETAFTETVSFIPETVFQRCKQINHGDLLMTLTGENKPDIAKTIAYIGTTPIAVGGDLAYWTKHGMNPLYLSYLMASPYVIEKKVELATGDRIVHISGAKLGTIPIPIPPLAEQARIVAKIEELLPYIEEYDAAGKRLTALNKKFPDQLRKSILQQAIMGKLTERNTADEPASELLKRIRAEKSRLVKEGKLKKEKPLPPITEDEMPFEIPEGWEWVRLQDAATAIVDCPHSTPKYLDNETGFYAIGTKGMNGDGEITRLFNVDEPTYLRRTERLVPHAGDIVYSREGSIICRAVILPEEKRICLGQRVMLIRCNIGFVLKFLQVYLMSELAISYLTRNYKGTGVRHVNVADVCSLPIPLPPLAEQQRIVERVEELLAVCGQLNR